jgi:hypothetical protein
LDSYCIINSWHFATGKFSVQNWTNDLSNPTDVCLLCGGDHAQAYVVMTYNAANMGSSLHKIAIFKGITEWDRRVNFLY